MMKYVELATRGKLLIRYELDDDNKLGKVETFKDGDFVSDYEVTEIVEKAFKFNVVSVLGKELTDQEAQQAVTERLAAYIDKKSSERK